ncbi:MAG: magnetosome biogenesis CDF transporter MamM [Magnetospirillum sp. WYHS-4]
MTSTLLLVTKAFVGLVSGSQAMLTDAMYSAKDVVTSLLVIVGMTVSEKPIDQEHPYGHGKIEFVLSLFVSTIFMVVTGYLLVHAVTLLFNADSHRAPHLIALWTAIVSIACNLGLYFYSRCVAVETNSPILRTMAKHHHSDATGSAAVAVGIIGSHYLGMPWLDTCVAVIEAVHLMFLTSEVFRDSYRGLLDRSLDRKVRDKMARIIKGTDGVSEVKTMRTRLIGQEVFAEITIGIDAETTVAEAYNVTERVKERILHSIPHIGALHVSASCHDEEPVSPPLRLNGPATAGKPALELEGT